MHARVSRILIHVAGPLLGATQSATFLICLVAVLNSDFGMSHDLRLRLQDEFVAAVVTFQLLVRSYERVGTRSTDLGQSVRLLLFFAPDETEERPEEWNGAGDNCGADFSGEPDEWESRAVCEIGVTGDE